MKYESITITGPTASGKTRRAVSAARLFNGEIISADSRQVYKGMDIGTGKDLSEYGDVPYHLIDIVPAGEKFNLHKYLQCFRNAYDDILRRGKTPIICGGTGMYLEAALAGLIMPEVPENKELRIELSNKADEELIAILKTYKILHNKTDIDTRQRMIRAIEIEEYYKEHPDEAQKSDRKKSEKLNSLIIAVDIPREERRRRITERLHTRLEEGMVDEIKGLLKSGISEDDLIYYGLEYKFVTLYATGKISYEEMFKGLETAIHQFAKRQMTWFRGMERRGFSLNWLSHELPETAFNNQIEKLFCGC